MATSSDKSQGDIFLQIKQVVEDLRDRPDYGADQKKVVTELNGFALLLKKYQATKEPSDALTEEVQKTATTEILPLIDEQISDNVSITKMGQLSTNRTISPAMAKEHNINLEALQEDVEAVATGDVPEKDLDPDAAVDLLLVDVMKIEMTSDPAIVEYFEINSGRAAPCSC